MSDQIIEQVAPSAETGGHVGSKRVHLAYLDGLRGALALYVVVHHCWIRGGLVARPGLEGLATNWMLYGHLAVNFFIVLSGFCLMIPVARTQRLAGGVLDFYARRARRILPPYYAILLIGLVLVVATHSAAE